MSSGVMSAQMCFTSAFKAANPRCRETDGSLEFGQEDVRGRVERGILASGQRKQCRWSGLDRKVGKAGGGVVFGELGRVRVREPRTAQSLEWLRQESGGDSRTTWLQDIFSKGGKVQSGQKTVSVAKCLCRFTGNPSSVLCTHNVQLKIL